MVGYGYLTLERCYFDTQKINAISEVVKIYLELVNIPSGVRENNDKISKLYVYTVSKVIISVQKNIPISFNEIDAQIAFFNVNPEKLSVWIDLIKIKN